MSDFPDFSKIGNPGPIDFAALAAWQASKGWTLRVALKCTEGASFVDPDYATRCQQAKAAGLFVIAYAFADPSVSGAAEAEHLLANMGDADLAAYDLEWAAFAPGEPEAKEVGFNSVLAQHQMQYLDYSPEQFIQQGVVKLQSECVGWWVPVYGPTRPAVADLVAWQYTDAGTVAGYTGSVDCSHVENEGALDVALSTTDQAWIQAQLKAIVTDPLFGMLEEGNAYSAGHVGLKDVAAQIAALQAAVAALPGVIAKALPAGSGVTEAQIAALVSAELKKVLTAAAAAS